MSNLDYEAWRCEKHGGFCPEDGCSMVDGCAKDKGWTSEDSRNYPDALKRPTSTVVDIDRLYSTTDARVWAQEFAKVCPEVDQGLMTSWFANAIETTRSQVSGIGPPREVKPHF